MPPLYAPEVKYTRHHTLLRVGTYYTIVDVTVPVEDQLHMDQKWAFLQIYQSHYPTCEIEVHTVHMYVHTCSTYIMHEIYSCTVTCELLCTVTCELLCTVDLIA